MKEDGFSAQKAGLHKVPIIVLDLDDNESLEIAIVENIQRDDLNAIEEARGYQRLSSEFRYDHEKIARFMSKVEVIFLILFVY